MQRSLSPKSRIEKLSLGILHVSIILEAVAALVEIIGETSVTIVATIFNNNVRHTLVCGVTLGLATIPDPLNKKKIWSISGQHVRYEQFILVFFLVLFLWEENCAAQAVRFIRSLSLTGGAC